ncbi:MAG: CorA family divalent cation transporter, partial [Miltoncostaeaceae bacterium]
MRSRVAPGPPARAAWFDMAAKTETPLEPGGAVPADDGFLWVDAEFDGAADIEPLSEAGLLDLSSVQADRSAGDVAWTLRDAEVDLVLAGSRMAQGTLILDRRHVAVTPGAVTTVHRGVPDHFERLRDRYRDSFAEYAKSHGFLLFEICGVLVDDLRGAVRDLGERIDATRVAAASGEAVSDEAADLLASLLLLRRVISRTRDLFLELSTRRHALVPETTQPYIRDMSARLDGLVADLAFSRDVVGEALRAASAAEPDSGDVASAPATAASAAEGLAIHSLGGMRVERAGTEIGAGLSEGAKQVLGALVCADGPVADERLAAWVWPDLEESATAAALDDAIAELDRLLDGEASAAAAVVRREGET